MTQEEKQLLLVDLCARLPYGVVCVGITYALDDDGERYIPVKVKNTLTEIHDYKLETANVRLGLVSSCELETVKPYLRSMDSMTEEEKKEFDDFCVIDEFAWEGNSEIGYKNQSIIMSDGIDWLNKHHFDYRGLTEKGLALEATEGMYN